MRSLVTGLASWSRRIRTRGSRGREPLGHAVVRLSRKNERRVWGVSLANAVLVLLVWLLLSVLSDVWWPVTLMAFGPRWVWGLPGLGLLPLAVKHPRAVLTPTVPALVLAFGPVMGFCVPWRSWLEGAGDGDRPLRLLSCNVHGSLHDPARLVTLVETTRPDLVALQEWTGTSEAAELFRGPGWHVVVDSDMCIASRFPIRDVQSLTSEELGGRGSALRCMVDGPQGPISFFNVHPKSARNGLRAALLVPWRAGRVVEANTGVRRYEAETLDLWAKQQRGPIVLAGDFNLPSDSVIYRRYWSDYTDAFDWAGLGYGYTWFSSFHGIRIDHVLAGPGWRPSRCWVAPDVGSDHRPLIAELEWIGGAREEGSGPGTLPKGQRPSDLSSAGAVSP